MSLGDDEHESHFYDADEKHKSEVRSNWRLVGLIISIGAALIVLAGILQGGYP